MSIRCAHAQQFSLAHRFEFRPASESGIGRTPVDGLGAFLLNDLVSDGSREHVARDVPGAEERPGNIARSKVKAIPAVFIGPKCSLAPYTKQPNSATTGP
jgi:hypothetical protein